MTAVAAIVLADAQATPVDHTFTPLGPDKNGVWWFEDQSLSTPLGYWRISLSLVRSPPAGNGSKSDANRVNRVKMGIHMPTMETLSNSDAGYPPAPTVSYVDRCNMEFILADRDSLQNRKDIRKFAQYLNANSQVVAMVETLQNVY